MQAYSVLFLKTNHVFFLLSWEEEEKINAYVLPISQLNEPKHNIKQNITSIYEDISWALEF